jgi:hypothetical protein
LTNIPGVWFDLLWLISVFNCMLFDTIQYYFGQLLIAQGQCRVRHSTHSSLIHGPLVIIHRHSYSLHIKSAIQPAPLHSFAATSCSHPVFSLLTCIFFASPLPHPSPMPCLLSSTKGLRILLQPLPLPLTPFPL